MSVNESKDLFHERVKTSNHFPICQRFTVFINKNEFYNISTVNQFNAFLTFHSYKLENMDWIVKDSQKKTNLYYPDLSNP